MFKENFLKGIYDNLFDTLNEGINSAEKYQSISVRNSRIYEYVARDNSDIKEAIRIWQSNIGDAGWSIQSNRYTNEKRNVNISSQIEKALKKIGFNKLKNSIVRTLALYGRTVITMNEDGKLVAHAPTFYEIFWDSYNQKPTSIKIKKDGVASGENLIDDVFVISLPDQEGLRDPSSPIDSAYKQILADTHIWKANNKRWAKGGIDPLFFLLDYGLGDNDTSMTYWENTEVSKSTGKAKKMIDVFVDRIKNLVNRGSEDPNAIVASPHIKDVKQIAKSVKEMMGSEFETKARCRIATSFGLNPADLGIEQAKYDNAQTYNYTLGDKIGQPIQQSIEELVNDFIFPNFLNIQETDLIVFGYEQPSDPAKEEKKKTFISAYQVSYASGSPAFTPNELRAKFDLHELSDLELEKLKGISVIDNSQNQETENQNFSKKKQSINSIKSTPTSKALKSSDYIRIEVDKNGNRKRKGFLANWEKAIEKQLEGFVENIKDKKNISDITKEDLPKIETFYSFPTLKKDLLKFADIGYQDFLKSEKKSANALKLPDLILGLIDNRVEALLKGNDLFDSVDEETASQILNAVKDVEDVSEAISFITDSISTFSKARARLIAETEVADAIENTKFEMYKEEKYEWKAWLTVSDDDVRPKHQDNENAGAIPINEPFPNGNMRAGEEPRCRCTTIYARTKEEL